jgi:enediyne polyketide synthase
VAPEHPLAASLRQAFASAPGQGVVVCLPPQADERSLNLLLKGVRARWVLNNDARFVLVQHGQGAAALARTLHLEMAEGTTCVIDVPVDHPSATTWVVAEATAAVGYTEAHYDPSGQRYEPVLRLLPLPTGIPPLPLSTDDILLVTGGGKGITAECALTLARGSGARLALLGRSQPETDAELAANLERMRVAGVDFRYLVADVTQAAEVRAAVQEVERTLGPVTGILHGAARNVPQLLRSLDEESCLRTLAPKLQGARNLLAAIQPDQLRLFVTFGSIIARTGLPGEADYGLANEWLADLTAQFQRAHPACRCLAIEWSVWAGAGMGERLGRLDALSRQGIMPISLDEGLAVLRRLLAHLGQDNAVALPTSVVVTGRFGSPPTLRVEQAELSFLRFLEETQVYYPGVELVVDASLAVDSDPYLADHVFRGERLLPAVMGLEAMTQVALALVKTTEPPIFEDVQFARPVVVPEQRSVTIRLAALMRAPGQVEVVLRSAETGFQVDHFRAICRFDLPRASQEATNRNPQRPEVTRVHNHESFPPVDLDPQHDLYGGILFHQGRFQRLRGYQLVTAKACVAEIRLDEATWFGRYLPPDRVLGDPAARDAVIHALQVCVPQATLLPIGVERLTPDISNACGPRFVYAQERSHEGNTFVYDVDVTDAEGHVQEHWQGLRLHAIDNAAFHGPWPAPLLGPYLERRLHEVWPAALLRVVVERDCTTRRRVRSDRALQRALGQAVPILRRPDGKPEAAWPAAAQQAISAAHAGELTLAVAGPPPLGCDLEAVEERPFTVWQDLLGAQRFQLAELIATEAGEDVATAFTRVWVASECLKKAGAAWDTPLVLATRKAESWVILAAGALRVATLVTQVRDVENRLVVGVAVKD